MNRALLPGAVLAGLFAADAVGQTPVRVLFLEPVNAVNTQTAEIEQHNVLYRPAANPEKYTPWLQNDPAARAFRLYRDACEIAHPGSGIPDYYVALVKGGNHAAVGFRVQSGDRIEEHPRQPYILLDAEESRFQTTLLHETGHMAMSMVAGGRVFEDKPVAAVPHTTAALTGRSTAFSEGYAIHLETVQAHLGSDSRNRQRFHRGMVLFGEGPFQATEYFRHSTDLTSYAQNVARYTEVRDNNFSFESAFQGPDYLRVQLEKARDFATVRDANQLLQSEGYYAAFFFLWVMRGTSVPEDAVIDTRERKVLRTMHAVLAEKAELKSEPWLLRVVVEYVKLFPEEKAAIVDALNDTSHGVFVDPEAAALWKKHYLAALTLDVENLNLKGLTAARKGWREQVFADPAVLFSRLGPEIACELPGAKIHIAAFGEDLPVSFDANTVQPGVLRLVPGISEGEITALLAARTAKPFATAADFQARSGLKPPTLASLKY
jgi:hypothetical protein